jgi:DNA-binding NtrC family response regulator
VQNNATFRAAVLATALSVVGIGASAAVVRTEPLSGLPGFSPAVVTEDWKAALGSFGAWAARSTEPELKPWGRLSGLTARQPDAELLSLCAPLVSALKGQPESRALLQAIADADDVRASLALRALQEASAQAGAAAARDIQDYASQLENALGDADSVRDDLRRAALSAQFARRLRESGFYPAANARVDAAVAALGEQATKLHQDLSRRTLKGAEKSAQELIGESAAVERLRLFAADHADHGETVLIEGESGTGKELVARSLHFGGQRGEHPFIAVNMSAIPDELFESTLFGHKKGSFTGAHADSHGAFEQAAGGTLFLDEIGELPRHNQVKLLRVLQERSVTPIGGAEIRMKDRFPRIVAATNRTLVDMVKEGTFRADLYYRLAVITTKLPPLRDRREDILFLARHFLRERQEGAIYLKIFSAAAEQALAAYDWPGNVRELDNVVRAALATAWRADTIDIRHLKPELVAEKPSIDVPYRSPSSGVSLSGRLAAFERNLILQTLIETGGNVAQAAPLLGDAASLVYFKLKQLRLEDDAKNLRSDAKRLKKQSGAAPPLAPRPTRVHQLAEREREFLVDALARSRTLDEMRVFLDLSAEFLQAKLAHHGLIDVAATKPQR